MPQRHKIGRGDFDLVLARELVTLGAALVIVERHARRNNVDQRQPIVFEPRLDDWNQLRLVT